MYAGDELLPTRGRVSYMSVGIGDCSAVALRDEQREAVVPSFAEIYELHFDDVARWARAMGTPAADLEDACQDVFVTARRRLSDLEELNTRTWLYRITSRTVRRYRRRAWVKRALFLGEERWLRLAAPTRDPEAELGLQERGELFDRALNRLSLVKRTALILHFVEGKSGEEIADLENVPVGTVYTRIYHAKRELTAHLRRDFKP